MKGLVLHIAISAVCLFSLASVAYVTGTVRHKRGGAGYPFGTSASSGYGGGGGSSRPSSMTDPSIYFYIQDASSPFISYLGGAGSGNTGPSSSTGNSGSSYGQSAGQPSLFDSNILNTFTLSRYGSSSGGASSFSNNGDLDTGASSWAPSTSYGGGYTVYTDYGILSPTFALRPASASSPRTQQRHAELPTLSATSLLHSAMTSNESQNQVFNAFASASPSHVPYKGGL